MRHNRITWFANIEGFLWLSFAAVISEKVGWDNGFWLLIVIPIIGILICLSAISAIWDADHAVEVLLKKWNTIHEDQPESPYAAIPVIGLTFEELKRDRPSSIPRWHFALFVLIGWSVGLTGVVVTKIGPIWWHVILCWIAILTLVGIWLQKWPWGNNSSPVKRLNKWLDVLSSLGVFISTHAITALRRH